MCLRPRPRFPRPRPRPARPRGTAESRDPTRARATDATRRPAGRGTSGPRAWLPRLHDFLDVRPLLEEDLGPAPLALDADGVDVRANRLLAHPALVHQDASSGAFSSASAAAGTSVRTVVVTTGRYAPPANTRPHLRH